MDLADSPAPIREGEVFDPAPLDACLREHIPGLDGELRVSQFPSGHSNLTYLLQFGDRELVMRRPPFGSLVKSAHDMGREYRILSALHPVYPQAPKPLFYSEDITLLGAPFYIMERVRGVILRSRPPAGFVLAPQDAKQCCETFIDNLAHLHSLDYSFVGLDALRKPGQYTERQVKGWSQRYTGSQTDDIPDIDGVIVWLDEHIPPDTGAVLIHNDYKFDNLVLDPNNLTCIVGVLDWEMATIGDPLMDLGTALGYWAEPEDSESVRQVQCFLSTLPGALSRREIARLYAVKTGRDVSNLLFYYVFALFKLAVIVQQIYYRYAQGLTKDARFGAMIGMVRALGVQSAAAIESGKIGK
jgi:aminoglycoside phosphotransferase (APT) family kinase protein